MKLISEGIPRFLWRGGFAGLGLLLLICQASARDVEAPVDSAADATFRKGDLPRSVLSVRTVNGVSTVFYHGEVVWSGPVRQGIRTKRVFLDGEEYAVAFDGSKVVWENRKRAGVLLRRSSQKTSAWHKERRTLGSGNSRLGKATIRVLYRDGETSVIYGGEEVWRGKAGGAVSAKTKRTLFREYAAAFAGDQVLWENVPGAGQRLLK